MSLESIIKEYIEVKINMNLSLGSILEELKIEYESFNFYDEYKSIFVGIEMHNIELSEDDIEKITEKTGFEFRKVNVSGKKFPYGNGDEIDYTYIFEC